MEVIAQLEHTKATMHIIGTRSFILLLSKAADESVGVVNRVVPEEWMMVCEKNSGKCDLKTRQMQ